MRFARSPAGAERGPRAPARERARPGDSARRGHRVRWRRVRPRASRRGGGGGLLAAGGRSPAAALHSLFALDRCWKTSRAQSEWQQISGTSESRKCESNISERVSFGPAMCQNPKTPVVVLRGVNSGVCNTSTFDSHVEWFCRAFRKWANSPQKNAREFFVLDLLHPPMGGCTQFLAN